MPGTEELDKVHSRSGASQMSDASALQHWATRNQRQSFSAMDTAHQVDRLASIESSSARRSVLSEVNEAWPCTSGGSAIRDIHFGDNRGGHVTRRSASDEPFRHDRAIRLEVPNLVSCDGLSISTNAVRRIGHRNQSGPQPRPQFSQKSMNTKPRKDFWNTNLRLICIHPEMKKLELKKEGMRFGKSRVSTRTEHDALTHVDQSSRCRREHRDRQYERKLVPKLFNSRNSCNVSGRRLRIDGGSYLRITETPVGYLINFGHLGTLPSGNAIHRFRFKKQKSREH